MSRVTKSIDVDRPVRFVYDQWTQFEDFPAFMEGVEQVRQIDDRHTEWTVEIAGNERSFTAEIVEQEPDRRISWRSLDGEDHTGAVTFEPRGEDSTHVEVEMSYRPETWAEKAADALNVIERRVGKDLQRFKELAEDESMPTGAWRGEIERREVRRGDTDEPI